MSALDIGRMIALSAFKGILQHFNSIIIHRMCSVRVITMKKNFLVVGKELPTFDLILRI